MKRKSAITLLLSAVMLISGCSFQGKQVYFTVGDGPDTVFRIDDLKCKEEEAKVYLANTYNLYGSLNDGVLWDMDITTDRILTNVKDLALENLSMVYAMNVYAEDEQITLSEKEEAAAERLAGEYYSTLSDKDKEYLGVNEEKLKGMYQRYLLAKKVYDKVISAVDDEVSEDEARIMRGYVIFCSEQKGAKAALKEIRNGEDVASVCRSRSEKDTEEVTFGRGTYDSAVEAVAFDLDNDQYSEVIEAAGGYYVVYCVEKYDKELSEENKLSIITTRKESMISDIINTQTSESYSGLNESKWNEMSPKPDDGVTTDQFFELAEGM